MLQQQTWKHFAKTYDIVAVAHLGFPALGDKLSLGARTQPVREQSFHAFAAEGFPRLGTNSV